jgi:hypothetical protein
LTTPHPGLYGAAAQNQIATLAIADITCSSRHVRFVPILLQKSVEGFREQ